MRFGLIGERLTHSYSCEIHAKIADYTYELHALAPAQLEDFLHARAFQGINVTIPYKQRVIPLLDEISDTARQIGAVNTIVNRAGRLCGYNTDLAGMKALIRRMGLEIAGKKVLILGTGGTAGTARAAMEQLGAAEILLVSRSGRNGAVTYEAAQALHADTEILINTTPIGMYPAVEGLPIDIAAFPHLAGIVDAIYHPLCTNLVLAGRERGIPSAGGLYMLAAQAVYASALFLDQTVCEAQIEAAYRAVLAEKQNVVLIGMPSSGKTSVGRCLSQQLGKPLLDTDDAITTQIGMPIPAYFAENGEAAFRLAEREAVAAAAKQSGHIIATGGGVVLDPANIRALRQNGVLIFIDRSLALLTATADRPLSSSPAALHQRYHERYPRYEQAADFRVDGDGSIEQTANRILEVLAT